MNTAFAGNLAGDLGYAYRAGKLRGGAGGNRPVPLSARILVTDPLSGRNVIISSAPVAAPTITLMAMKWQNTTQSSV